VSLFKRRAPEVRHVTGDVSAMLTDYRNARVGSLLDISSDQAMRHAAVWACVRLIAGTVSTLPVDVVREVGDRRDPMSLPLITAPSAVVSPITWRDQLVVSMLLRGNAYGLITQVDRAGYPVAIELIHPDKVMGRVQDGRVRLSWDGQEHDLWPLGDAIHVPAFTVPGSPFGLSVLDYARTTIGSGLASEEWGARFFTDGAVPSAVLSTDQAITREQAQELKARFMAAVAGKREPAVLGAGVAYTPISVSPGESAFLETWKMSGENVCRLFGVQPEMVGLASSGSSVTYANREQRVQDFLTFTLSPWLARVEEALSALLPPDHVLRFRTGGLLRADIQTRYAVYEASARISQMTDGAMPLTVDEMRALEDLPPLPRDEEVLSPTDMAEVARRLYLSVGKVVTVDEAREILRRAGLPLETLTPEDVFANLPPMPESNRGETSPDDPAAEVDPSADADADANADADLPDTDEDNA
jgi:HK97 family phage portal protein